MTKPTDIKLHVEVEGQGLVHVHPETNTLQVIDNESGRTLQEILENVSSSTTRTVYTPFSLIATSANQTSFEFQDPFFNASKDNVIVHVNGEFMHPEEEYTITMGELYPSIILAEGLAIDDRVHVLVERDAIIDGASYGFYRTQTVKHTVVATTPNQTIFDFKDPYFRKEHDSTIVFLQAEPLIEGEEYSLSEAGSVLSLAEGVPVDTKIHIIVLRDTPIGDGSTGGSGLTNEQLALLNTIIPTGDYFLDGTNGDDNNDGRTKETAWKTISKVNDAFMNKRTGTANLYIAGGTYEGYLHIRDFDGDLNIKPYQDESVVFYTPTTSNIFTNVASFSIIGNIKFTASADFPGDLMTISNVGRCYMNHNVVFEGGKGAIYSEYSKIYMNSQFINQETHLMRLSSLAEVVIADHIYNAKVNLVSILCSAKYRSYNPRAGSQTELVSDFANSATDFNKVAQGIIIEEGTNENGRYVKYANGRLECFGNKSIASVGGGTENVAEWVFPHIMTHDPLVHGFVDLYINVKTVTSNMSDVDGVSHGYDGNSAGSKSTIRFKTNSTQQVTFNLMAIGRWK